MQSESGESSWPATSTHSESKDRHQEHQPHFDWSLLSESGLHYTRPRAYSIQTKRSSYAKLLLASDLMGRASLYRATGTGCVRRPYAPVLHRQRTKRSAQAV